MLIYTALLCILPLVLGLPTTSPAPTPIIVPSPDNLLARESTAAPTSTVTPPPDVLLARQYSTTSAPISICTMSIASAFTLDGESYPSSAVCACNDGWLAGVSASKGPDGSTTWDCAVGTPMPVSTQAPAPTWVYRVDIGSHQFMIGDYDQAGFLPLMEGVCNGAGCDAGTHPSFQFNWTESNGWADTATGTITMTGFENGPTYANELLQVLNTALLKTSDCQQVSTIFPSLIPNVKRESGPGETLSEQTVVIPQCHIVDFIQVSLWDNPDFIGSTQGTMSMSGSSTNPDSSLCSDILGGIAAALAGLTLPAYVSGGVTIAKAFCLAP